SGVEPSKLVDAKTSRIGLVEQLSVGVMGGKCSFSPMPWRSAMTSPQTAVLSETLTPPSARSRQSVNAAESTCGTLADPEASKCVGGADAVAVAIAVAVDEAAARGTKLANTAT